MPSNTASSARGENAIEVRGLEKSYGEWPVLWDLDLTVPWGETLALFGANGAGKTTLLRILSTHVRADGGSAVIAGRDLRRQPGAVRRHIGVVGHRSFLYGDLTCRENLVYYGRLYGLRDCETRAADALRRVGLSARANHRVRDLSNGMQKRAAIARAILHEPVVLLLDEPEAGLDRESREMFGSLLREWTGAGRSAVIATHDIDLGLSWARRAGVLADGRVSLPEEQGAAAGAAIREALSGNLGLGNQQESRP